MPARRGWLLLLAILSLLALAVLVRVSFFIAEDFLQQAAGEKYAVYIDGGSSGTRVRVYRYRPARWPSYVVLHLPEPSMSVEPGLSVYASEPWRAADSLAPLLEFAYEQVPAEHWAATPVRLLATAGLRLLTAQEQAAILSACQGALGRSRFLFQPGWASVIDGEMEGLYGWAAVNYITGALQEASGHAHHSRREVLDPAQLFLGLLEMGGASMQVTFLPPTSAKVATAHGLHLHLPGVPSRLFTRSYLGLGMDAALARAAEYVLAEQRRQRQQGEEAKQRQQQQQQQEEDEGKQEVKAYVSDPCLPIGYVTDDGRLGNASFSQCLAVVSQILPQHNCSNDSTRGRVSRSTTTTTTSSVAESAAALATATEAHQADAASISNGDGEATGHGSPAAAGTMLASEARTLAGESYSDDPTAAAAARSTAAPEDDSGGDGGCILQDGYVPALVGRFVAVENFAWTARALGLPESATLRQLREHGSRYCTRHWSSLHSEFSDRVPDQFLIRYCFGAAYILALLHRGLGVGLDDSRLHWTNTVREGGSGTEVGINWVLGAAIVDAMSSSGGSGSGGGGGSGSGSSGTGAGTGEVQRFLLRDENGMAAEGGGPMALLLPLVALAALAVVVVFALLRTARGARAPPSLRLRGVSFGGAGAAGPTGSGPSLGGAGGEDLMRGRSVGGVGWKAAGEGGRLGPTPTAWSSSSLVSEATAGRYSLSAEGRDVVQPDPGIGFAGSPLSPSEGGGAGTRHHSVVRASAAQSATMRRNPSFTSVYMGAEPSAGQQ